MILSDQQINFFREEGYLAIPDLFDEKEVAEMQTELGRLKEEGHFFNITTAGDGQTYSKQKQNLALDPIGRKSKLFKSLPFRPKVIEIIGRLIGMPYMLHRDQIFLKPANHGQGTGWHQDNFYFTLSDPTKGTAMWIAIHEANKANGTMRLIPKRFRERFEHSRDENSDHHFRCYPPEEEAVYLELPAGGAAFFNYGVAHCTGPNKTDKERAGLAIHFFNEKYKEEAALLEEMEETPVFGRINQSSVDLERKSQNKEDLEKAIS